MKANDEKYPKARYDFDTNPQVYGFKVGKTYRFRDFGRGVEVFYDDGCSLAMGHNMFNECFTKITETNEAPKKIYLQENTTTDCYGEWWPEWFEARATDTDIEYTRTDAFIEEACKWLKENKDKYLYNTGERNEYIPTCSTKMIEEFRKYMKGEYDELV